jgi:hypothetical protein
MTSVLLCLDIPIASVQDKAADFHELYPQLWILYMRLPTPVSRDAREQYRLKREVVQLKREMNATSSQDEFAKWAKLRRRHDKTLEDYEAKSSCPFVHLRLPEAGPPKYLRD